VTKLILGLGNPGTEYAQSRHNLGFRVIEELARRRGILCDREECRCRCGEDSEVILAAPQTFMNRSGYAARCLVERRALAPGDVLVVYDDVDLPLGKLRVRASGTPGGHRGMESVIESLRTRELPRLRLGIAPAPEQDVADLAAFVLTPFTASEEEIVARQIERAADACLFWLEHGIGSTMNRFN
jgi:PTH1 family peptidyl-tRNA hydrolase